jgi:hypothetical protein
MDTRFSDNISIRRNAQFGKELINSYFGVIGLREFSEVENLKALVEFTAFHVFKQASSRLQFFAARVSDLN